MKKVLSLMLIFILSASLITSCKKNKGNPPVLPPKESMSIDFSNFVSGKKSADLISEQKGAENSNWEFAALVAGVWKSIINITLAIPVASFKLAIDQTPVYLEEKTWQWSYNVTVAGIVYKAKLTGQIRTTDVLWKMQITKSGTGGFTDFFWFDGTAKLDGTGGQWILYESAQVPGAILQIDWTKTGTAIGTIKYKYVKNDSFKNNFIEYGLTTGTFDAFYNIQYFNGAKLSDVNVEWNTITHNGKVKCLDYLGDIDWHCWDANKINILCP